MSRTELSHINHKHLLCSPILLWYKVLDRRRQIYTSRNALWCSNTSTATECIGLDQRGWFISALNSFHNCLLPHMLVEFRFPILFIESLQQWQCSFSFNHPEGGWHGLDFQSRANIVSSSIDTNVNCSIGCCGQHFNFMYHEIPNRRKEGKHVFAIIRELVHESKQWVSIILQCGRKCGEDEQFRKLQDTLRHFWTPSGLPLPPHKKTTHILWNQYSTGGIREYKQLPTMVGVIDCLVQNASL